MKGGIVAALVGSAAAAAHQGHNGFHFRRHATEEGVCTVYTTVYVTASAVPVPSSIIHSAIPTSSLYAALSSASVPVPAVPASSSCTESSSSVYQPVPVSSSSVYVPVPAPSSSSVYVSVPAPSSSSVYVSVPASSSSVYVPVPAPSSSVHVSVPVVSSTKPAPVPSTTEAPVPSSTKSETPKPTGGSGYSTHLVPNGQKLCITYTPYAADGQCMSASQVQSDIAKIAGLGYTCIRVYSTDCGVFDNVVPACTKHSLNIVYGIFLDANKAPGSTGANEQLDAIIKNAPKDSFAMLIVGNEYMSGHGGSAAALAPYIKTCKQKLLDAGFPSTIPVTTTETVGALEQYGAQLCDSIDVLAAQIHPYFDGGIAASGAGDFAVKQLAQAGKVCPKAAANGSYITEIGWPSAGQANGVAVPGVAEQKTAIDSIIKAVGEKATLFSWQNDAWKEPGNWGVEQNFGCASALA